MNASVRWLLRIVVGAGLLAATLWWASPGDFMSTLARTNATAIFAVLVLILQIFASAERWRSLIRAAGASLGVKNAVQIGFVASLSGQIMPGGVGAELARIGMGRSTGMEWSKLVSLAVMDRLLLVMALIVTVACGLAVVSPALRPPIMLGVIASSLAVSTGMIWLASGKSTPKFAETLLASVRSVLGGASLRPILLLRAAAIALFGPANMALAAWFLANAMQIPLSIGVAVIWIPLVLAAAVALLGQAGIPASEAVALSVGIGIAALIAALPGAFMVPISLRTPSPPR